ncbi:hypothetical protein M5689_024564 [Euphorbia peplus]|nr:hypothetical protein M5689_024564 [Euphorbia peplus]
MLREYDTIQDINSDRKNWRIKVRVLRLWKVPNHENKDISVGLGMVLLDEKDNTIEAWVWKDLVHNFVHTIKEGCSYVFQNFSVVGNIGPYKAAKHPFKLNFMATTWIQETEFSEIKKLLFDLTPLESILANTMDASFLVDVIAEVTWIENDISIVMDKYGKQRTDIGNKIIQCTFWDDYAIDIAGYTTLSNCPVIIILQYAKIGQHKGQSTLSNALYASKLFHGDDFSDIVAYKQSLREQVERTRLSFSSNQTSFTNDFLQNCQQKTLAQINETKEEGVFVVIASVVCIEANKGWCYVSCARCKKKLHMDGNTYKCVKCIDKNIYAVPRYRIQVRVMDETASASFVIFDSDAYKFIGKNAADLKSSLSEDDDKRGYPSDLTMFLDKKFVFKINVTEYNMMYRLGAYSVSKMTYDDGLIEELSKRCEVYSETVAAQLQDQDVGCSTTPTTFKRKRIILEDNSDESSPIEDESSATKVKIETED